VAGQPDERLTRPAGNSATATQRERGPGRWRARRHCHERLSPLLVRPVQTFGAAGSSRCGVADGERHQFRCGSIFGRNRCSRWLGAELAPTRDGEVMAAPHRCRARRVARYASVYARHGTWWPRASFCSNLTDLSSHYPVLAVRSRGAAVNLRVEHMIGPVTNPGPDGSSACCSEFLRDVP
jgi:hypothetical protein